MIPWLEADTPFPPVNTALSATQGAAGLLAAGADLSPARLLQAYRLGIFPWYSQGQPILWWSTDPRLVLFTADFIVRDSLRKTLKKIQASSDTDQRWQVRFDTAFADVMRACAAPRRAADGRLEAGTWITEDIIAAYSALHRLGFAHSCEVWHDGNLVGGAYGVSIGHMFYGESMFARVTDASKVALAALVRFLAQRGVRMIDCQQETPHLCSLGAVPISRNDFLAHLASSTHEEQIVDWRLDRLI